MKGSIILIMVSAVIITSCDLFVTSEDKKDTYTPPPISGAVSITPSDPCLGDTLRASLEGPGYNYDWERADTKNGEWRSISVASSSYPLRIDDKEKYIRVTVSQINRSGSLTSAAVYVGVRTLAGSVSINGNAVEGETLTADTDGIEGFKSYRWERADTKNGEWIKIWEGEEDRYTVQLEDVGKYIRLTVTRLDDSASITSEATAAVVFNIHGDPAVNRSLWFHGDRYDASGCQWERADTEDGAWIAIGVNTTSYSLDEADRGKYIRVTITRADNTRIYSKVVGPILLPLLLGTVSISETVDVGETLNADTSHLWGNGEMSYWWERWDGENSPREMVGDNSPAYTVVREDAGKQIQVTVTRSENSGSITSNRTDAVALSPLDGYVYVNGTFNVDSTLTALTDDLGGSGEIAYQWERSSVYYSPIYTNIGDDSPTYTITDEDVGKYIRVTVRRADNTGSISSRIYLSATNNLSGTVSIIGDAVIGETLTAAISSLTGKGTITYQWSSGGTGVGANSDTYTIAPTDFDKTIYVRVRRSDRSDSVASPQTDKVVMPSLTGTVSISGTAAVGERLTAVTSSLGGSGTLNYQWQLGDDADGPWTNIGSNTPSYDPVLEQEGKYIRLTVTRAYSVDSISSEEAGPIIILPLSGTVRITGTAAVEQTLTANTSNLEGSGDFTYQWESADTAAGPWVAIGSNNSSYQLVWVDLGKYIRLTISRANNAGSVSSEATAAVANPRLAGSVSINGTVRDGETLTAGTGNLMGSGPITYQWQRGDTASAATWTDVGSASSYFLTSADVGKYIRLTVTRDGYSGSVSSTTSAVALPLLTGSVSISGTARGGETLTAVTDSLGGSGTIAYQWLRNDPATSLAWIDIGSNSATYIPVVTDAGKIIRLTVTRSGNSGSVSSDATSAVTIDAMIGSVSISGTAKVGQTLSAVTGSFLRISYQWQKASSANATTWTNIGTSSSSYSPVKADAGAYIRVTVSSDCYTGSLTSNATSAVTIDPLTGFVTISKSSNHATLTADTSFLEGSGDITYKWERAGLAGVIWVDLNASGSSYNYTPLQVLGIFRVTVTRANNSGEKTATQEVRLW